MKENLYVRDKAIGRIKYEGIVKVDIRLEWRDSLAYTVEHYQVDGYWTFGVTASMWHRINSTDCYFAGRLFNEIGRLGTDVSRKLVTLGRKWGSNNMKAGCIHQGKPARAKNGGIDIHSVPPCELTGYRYGSAWLLSEIPADVLEEMRQLMEEINGL